MVDQSIEVTGDGTHERPYVIDSPLPPRTWRQTLATLVVLALALSATVLNLVQTPFTDICAAITGAAAIGAGVFECRRIRLDDPYQRGHHCCGVVPRRFALPLNAMSVALGVCAVGLVLIK